MKFPDTILLELALDYVNIENIIGLTDESKLSFSIQKYISDNYNIDSSNILNPKFLFNNGNMIRGYQTLFLLITDDNTLYKSLKNEFDGITLNKFGDVLKIVAYSGFNQYFYANEKQEVYDFKQIPERFKNKNSNIIFFEIERKKQND